MQALRRGRLAAPLELSAAAALILPRQDGGRGRGGLGATRSRTLGGADGASAAMGWKEGAGNWLRLPHAAGRGLQHDAKASRRRSRGNMGAVHVITHLQEHVEYQDSRRRGGEGQGREDRERRVIPLSTLEEMAVNIIDTFAPRDLAMTMNKYGKIGIPPGPALLAHLERRGVAMMFKYQPVELANTMHAYAKLGMYPGEALLETLGARAVAVSRDFIPQGLANLLWAYAKLGLRMEKELFGALEAQIVAQIGGFGPHDIAVTIWAYATLGVRPGDELLRGMGGQAVEEMRMFKPQDVSNTIWAYAKLGVMPGEELLGALEGRAMTGMQGFQPQHIANTIWAYATLGVMPSAELLEHLHRQAMAEMRRFIPQHIANTSWAYAKLGVNPGEELLGRLQKQAMRQMGGYKPQHIANTMWAYARHGVMPPRELIEGLEAQAVAEMGSFKTQEIANTIWAYAKLGVTPGEAFLAGLQAQAVGQRGDFKPQEIASTMWAYAAMGVVPGEELLAGLREQAKAHLEQGSVDLEFLRPIHQFLLFLELAPTPPGGLPDDVAELREKLGDAGRVALAESSTTDSAFQREVAAVIRGMGYKCETGAKDPVSGYSIDLLIRHPGGCGGRGGGAGRLGVAIEVDGPSHYLADSRKPSGATILKRRLLRQIGYYNVSVPGWEWRSRTGEEKVAYMETLLAGAVEEGWGGLPLVHGQGGQA